MMLVYSMSLTFFMDWRVSTIMPKPAMLNWTSGFEWHSQRPSGCRRTALPSWRFHHRLGLKYFLHQTGSASADFHWSIHQYLNAITCLCFHDEISIFVHQTTSLTLVDWSHFNPKNWRWTLNFRLVQPPFLNFNPCGWFSTSLWPN